MPRTKKKDPVLPPLTAEHDSRPTDSQYLIALALANEFDTLPLCPNPRERLNTEDAALRLGRIEWIERTATEHGIDLTQRVLGFDHDGNYTLVELEKYEKRAWETVRTAAQALDVCRERIHESYIRHLKLVARDAKKAKPSLSRTSDEFQRRCIVSAGRRNALQPHEQEAALTMATDLAREMHEENFQSRRGIGAVKLGRKSGFYIYDNNPYGDDPARPFDAPGTRRSREHAALVEFMASRGCKLAGQASYPPPGDDEAGYTVALVFLSASKDQAKSDESAAHDFLLERLAGAPKKPKPALYLVPPINSPGGAS